MRRYERLRTVRRNWKDLSTKEGRVVALPAQPKRAMVDRRTATKLIRFHPDELREITERARRSGLTPARFIRETALGATPKARAHAADQPLLRELARIGRSLEQLANRAHDSQGRALAKQTTAALERHQALVRHIGMAVARREDPPNSPRRPPVGASPRSPTICCVVARERRPSAWPGPPDGTWGSTALSWRRSSCRPPPTRTRGSTCRSTT